MDCAVGSQTTTQWDAITIAIPPSLMHSSPLWPQGWGVEEMWTTNKEKVLSPSLHVSSHSTHWSVRERTVLFSAV